MSGRVVFKDRVEVITHRPGPGAGSEYAGAYGGAVARYSAALAGASHSPAAPPDVSAMDVESLPRFGRPPARAALPAAPVVISGWHYKSNGCVYQGASEHCSVVVNVEGNVVVTASGSRYLLSGIDHRIDQLVQFVLRNTSHADLPDYDSNANPLSPAYVPLLVVVERFVYGDLSQHHPTLLAGLPHRLIAHSSVFQVKPALFGNNGLIDGAYTVLQWAYDAGLAEPALFKTLWGVTQPLAELLPQLKARGYQGVEACMPFTSPADRAALLSACRAGTISKVVLMLQTSGDSVSQHLASLDAQLAEAVAFSAHAHCINIHGGADSWSFSQSSEYFAGFLQLEQKYKPLGLGMPLLHETHRGRILYSPWASVPLLRAFPTLLLTADLSHWVVVGERHLAAEELELVAARTRHIHARPCSPNQIQLRSCASPHHAADLEAFKGYWRTIFKAQIALGTGPCSVDPELGPFPYHPVGDAGVLAGQAELDAEIDVVVAVVRSCWREASAPGAAAAAGAGAAGGGGGGGV